MKIHLKIIFYIGTTILQLLSVNCRNEGIESEWYPMEYKERKVIFYSLRDGYSQIYAVDSNGENLVNLSNSSSYDLEPVYSRNGNKIAYRSNIDNSREIIIMDSDGSNKIQLTNNGRQNYNIQWSPDSMKILFSSSNNNFDDKKFHIKNIDNSNEIILNKSIYAYTWSPDSSKIAFISDRNGERELL